MTILEKFRAAVSKAFKADEATPGKIYYDKKTQTYRRRKPEKPVPPDEQPFDQKAWVRAMRLDRRRTAAAKRKLNKRYRAAVRKRSWEQGTLKAQAEVLGKGRAYWVNRGQVAVFDNVYRELDRKMKETEA